MNSSDRTEIRRTESTTPSEATSPRSGAGGGVASYALRVATLGRIATATLFLKQLDRLGADSDRGELRRLKSEMDAADDAWHSAYQEAEVMGSADQRA